jgi:hypothetical protein
LKESAAKELSEHNLSLNAEHDETRLEIVKGHVRTLLAAYEELLVEEFDSGHASLNHVIHSTSAENGPSDTDIWAWHCVCDFCGADVFQSYFECQSCNPNEQNDDNDAGGILLCTECYVEGRTCECEEMEPTQFRPFKELLDVRNRAVDVLNEVLDPEEERVDIWGKRYTHIDYMSLFRVTESYFLQ